MYLILIVGKMIEEYMIIIYVKVEYKKRQNATKSDKNERKLPSSELFPIHKIDVAVPMAKKEKALQVSNSNNGKNAH